ncbi:hypothetical protein TNCV_2253801 [Trichonephila clavipes]|nr:hypothetical protein TNCV_2253801 [Trichonephila clavipes]
MVQCSLLNVDLLSGREKKKRKIGMARKRAENREGSLGFPGAINLENECNLPENGMSSLIKEGTVTTPNSSENL